MNIGIKKNFLQRFGSMLLALLTMMVFFVPVKASAAANIISQGEDTNYYVTLETVEDTNIFDIYLAGGSPDKGRDLKLPDTTSANAYLFRKLSGGTVGQSAVGSYYFNKTDFDSLSETNKKAALGKFYDILNGKDLEMAKMTPKSRQAIQDCMTSRSPEAATLWTAVVLDKQSADVGGGVNVLSGALPYVRIVFGVLLIVIILGIVLTTSIDLGVLLVPAVNDFMSKKSKGGEGGGDGKIPFISKTCAVLLKETTSSGDDGKGAKKYIIGTYFMRRSFEIIIAVVALTILLLGSFGSVITSLMDMVN